MIVTPNLDREDSFFDRWYPRLLIALWVLFPELRRLVDWRVGFNSISVINVIPVLALLPLVPVVLRNLRRGGMSYGFKAAAILWVAAFGYALIVGYLSGRLIGALYECAIFTFPMLLGCWLATMEPSLAKRIFDRFTTAALWLAGLVSIYGIFQYVSPPPWDVYWMVNSGLRSIGNPVPFEVRVFSTLNSPLTCADFLSIAILLTLHRFRAKNIWLALPLGLSTMALVLTLVRTAWLMVALGVVVFLIMSPRRGLVLGTAAVGLVLALLVVGNLTFLTGNPQLAIMVQDRLSTFNDLSNDVSAESRVSGTEHTVQLSLEEPLGQGLGYSSGAKLSGASAATSAVTAGADNGYAERFYEMGIFGFGLYLASIFTALLSSFVGLRRFVVKDDSSATIFAVLISIQIALIGGDLSADHHVSLTGIFYWIVVGFGSSIIMQSPARSALSKMLAHTQLDRPFPAR